MCCEIRELSCHCVSCGLGPSASPSRLKDGPRHAREDRAVRVITEERDNPEDSHCSVGEWDRCCRPAFVRCAGITRNRTPDVDFGPRCTQRFAGSGGRKDCPVPARGRQRHSAVSGCPKSCRFPATEAHRGVLRWRCHGERGLVVGVTSNVTQMASPTRRVLLAAPTHRRRVVQHSLDPGAQSGSCLWFSVPDRLQHSCYSRSVDRIDR